MKLENVIIPTAVAKAGMHVRDVIRDCVEAGVRAIPYCDEHNRVTGLCSLKHIAKHALVPEYMVEAANVLGDNFRVLEEAQARVRDTLDQPIEPFVYDTYVAITSNTPLMKAIAVIYQNRTDYALVIDDQQYKGLVNVLGIAQRMLEMGILPKHLDPDLLDQPPEAMDVVRLELRYMGERVRQMLTHIVPALLDGDDRVLDDLARLEDDTDTLHSHIISYLGKISEGELTPDQTQEIIGLMEVTNDLEHIADVIQFNMVTLTEHFIKENVTLSEQARAAVLKLADLVVKAFDLALKAVTEKDLQAAEEALGLERQLDRQADAETRAEARQILIKEPDRLYAYTREMEAIQNLTHIYTYIERFAATIQSDT